MSNAQNIIQVATDLQTNHNKAEIIAMARSLGWKGDHARAPMLQLALYVATKLAAGERADPLKGDMSQGGDADAKHGAESSQQQDSQQQGQQAQGQQQGEQAQGQQQGQQAQGDNGQAPQGQQQSQQGQQQSQQAQGEQQDSQQGQQQSQQAQGEQQQPQEQQQQQQQQQQQDSGEQQQQQQQQQQDSGEQQQQQQQEQEQQDANKEWRDMLDAAGIARPHRDLRKLYTLTVKARQNVMLIGPAASGKTFLCEQLAQLLKLPFGSISCTMGMSESQLTGWLLPTKKAGKFGYVPAPFVQCIQSPSVFLLDEVDGADPNVLMLLNSVMSNGFITVPQKLDGPTIRRHDQSIIVAGANTTGSGADDVYSARTALDGATLDRFYPFVVSYDEQYEKSLFMLPGSKMPRAAAGWKPSGSPFNQSDMDTLHGWFNGVRAGVKKAKMQRIVSTRMAQRLVSAVAAGVPVSEVKRDLLTGWSADELSRVGM